MTSDDVVAALAAAEALRLEEAAAQRQLTDVQTTRLYYESMAYSKLLEIYSRCQRIVRADRATKDAIAACRQFLKAQAQVDCADENVERADCFRDGDGDGQ